MSAHADEFPPEPAGGEIVQWMEPRLFSLRLSSGTTVTLAAFALGAVAALAAVALIRRLSDDD